MAIIIKSEKDLKKMRKAGIILATVLNEIEKMIIPGISPLKLDEYAEKRILELGGKPAFKGYNGFPNTICSCPNSQVVHGIPQDKPLLEGDIITIDCGVVFEGFYSDSAFTAPVGKCDPDTIKFLETTKNALEKAMEIIKPGVKTIQISEIIEKIISGGGYGIIKEMSGHGIGKNLHEDPYVLNYTNPKQSVILEEGMTIAIEPISSMGSGKIKTLSDSWTTQTCDNSLSAQFEHTVAVTKNGFENLTKRPE